MKDGIFNVVEFAQQILDMDLLIQSQKREIARLLEIEKKYNELLSSSVENSQVTAWNILKMTMVPGVTEALETFSKNSNYRPSESNPVQGDDLLKGYPKFIVPEQQHHGQKPASKIEESDLFDLERNWNPAKGIR